jgi:hypothetical protein
MKDSCAAWYLFKVIWFFQREKEQLQIETTHDSAKRTFELSIMSGDGAPRIESFKSKRAFETRLRELEDELLAEHWTASGSSLLPRVTTTRLH